MKKEIRELNAPAIDLIADILDKHVDAILGEVRIRFKQIKTDQSSEPAEPCASLMSDKTVCGSENEDCDSQSAEPVKVNAIFETEDGPFIGKTDAKVKRVEVQDDGVLTVVIDHWPQPAEPVTVPEGYVLIAEDYLEEIIGPERMDHLRRSCRFPVPKRTPNTQPAEPVSQHPDDVAVDAFAVTMKAKLKRAREEKGRGGWQDMSAAELSAMLREHVEKGDPVDVANFAMMLHQNGQGITPAEPVKMPSDAEILELSQPFGAFQYGDAQGRKRIEFARALLARYGV